MARRVSSSWTSLRNEREWGKVQELNAAEWAYEEGRRTAKELQDARERAGLDPVHLARSPCEECGFCDDPT